MLVKSNNVMKARITSWKSKKASRDNERTERGQRNAKKKNVKSCEKTDTENQ